MRTAKLSLIIATLLVGCSSSPDKEQVAAPTEDRKPSSAQSGEVKRPDVATATTTAPGLDPDLAALRDPKSILSKRSVYFEYDSYTIREDFKSLLDAHAKFLVSHPKMKMLIQGNADERGSREYNLALGQKRSDAVKKALAVLGVKEEQVESVSLGEEKPKNEGHDEAAWAENRRADILYSGEF